jgi:hypothetical protein
MDNSNNDNKSKVVTSIDINIQWPSRKAWLDESIDDHLNCILCGGALQFAHKTDFITGVVTEDAHCPSCKIRNRQASYGLQ